MRLFASENPSTGCLSLSGRWLPNSLMKKIDYCQYRCADGLKYGRFGRKPTAIWSNIEGWEPRTCKCGRHQTSLIGDKSMGKGGSEYFSGGSTAPGFTRNMVPHEFHIELLTAAKKMNPKGTWVLDLFCGTGSMRGAAAELGLDYVGVDIREKIYKGRANRKLLYNRPDLVEDLSEMNLDDVIHRGGKLIGREPGELLMTWASPPCITFSQLDRLRKPEKRHRDLTTPTREAISEEAKRDDLLVAHVARELIEYANGGEEHWEGWCISLRQPTASQVVHGQLPEIEFHTHLDNAQWIGVHACDCVPHDGAVVGFVFARQTGQGKWSIEASLPIIDPVAASGSINMFRVDGLRVPEPLRNFHPNK